MSADFRRPGRRTWHRTVLTVALVSSGLVGAPPSTVGAWGTPGLRLSVVEVQASATAGASGLASAGGSILMAGNVTATGSAGSRTDFDPGPGSVNLINSSGGPYVAKYDSSGNYAWAKVLTTGSSSNGTAVTADSSGNVYFAGRFQASSDLDPGAGAFNVTDIGLGDAFVVKFTSSGTFVWGTKIQGGATGGDQVWGLTLVGNDVVAIGNFGGTMDPDGIAASGDEISAGASGDDVFITRLDGSSGASVWFRSFGSDGTENARSVTSDSSGNIYVVGKFQNRADFDPSPGAQFLVTNGNGQPTGGCDDAFITSLDSSGNFRWANRFGSVQCYDAGTSVVLSLDGSTAYFGGHFTGTSVAKYGNDSGTTDTATAGTSASGQNGFVIAADAATGGFQWFRQVRGSTLTSDERVTSLTMTTAGRLIAGGYFGSSATGVTFGDGTTTFEMNAGSGSTYDPFVWEMSTAGTTGWVRTFGGTTNDFVNAVAPGPSGGVIATGTFTGTADFDTDPVGTSNVSTVTAPSTSKAQPYVLQLDSNGLSAAPAAPTVSSVSPSSGPAAGGTSITVSGTGFVSGATVTVGGSACTSVTFISSSSLSCTTPAGSAGAANVVVTNPDSQTGTGVGAFTFVAAPTVSSVSPSSGPAVGGTSITVSGTGFVSGATVTVGGSACSSVAFSSATSLTCTTPAGSAGAANVVVTNPDSQTGTGVGAFTFVAAPTVSSVSPSSGITTGGVSVTLTGSGFLSGATVTIGGVSCVSVVVVSLTSITCTTGASSTGSANVVVTNTDGQSGTLSGGFTVTATTTTTTTTTSTTTTTVPAPVPSSSSVAPGGSTTSAPALLAAAPAGTTAPAVAAPGAPSLVTSSNQAQLTAAPGEAVAIINGKAVEVETVKTDADATPAEQIAVARKIVSEIASVIPAGSKNPIAVVDTGDGAEISGLMTNPEDPTEKLNVPVESVTLVDAGDSKVLISALNQTNLPAEVASGGVLQVTRGGIVAARAYGLPGSETGEIVLMSTPRLLKTFTVDSTGAYIGQVPLPRDISFGTHTVVMATKNAKVSLGIKLVRTRMVFRIKRTIGTTIFKNRAGVVKRGGGKVTVSGAGRCKATATKVTMASKPGACYVTVRQAAKGRNKAIFYRFTVSVVKKLPKKSRVK